MHNGHSKYDRPLGRWWKVLLGAVVMVLIGLAIVIHQLDSIMLTQINRALNHHLTAGGPLGRVKIRLFALDHRKMEKGLLETTTGTLELTVDSVADTGKAAGGGLTKSALKLTDNHEARQAWDQGIAARHRAAMQLARDALAKMPYPPVTE